MEKSKPLNISFDLKDGYLEAIVSGKNESFTPLVEVTKIIYKEVQKTNSDYILLDFIDVELKLSWADGYNLVKLYDLSMPKFKGVATAFIHNDNSSDYIKYWRKVATKRGYSIELFVSRNEAEQWLHKLIKD